MVPCLLVSHQLCLDAHKGYDYVTFQAQMQGQVDLAVMRTVSSAKYSRERE